MGISQEILFFFREVLPISSFDNQRNVCFAFKCQVIMQDPTRVVFLSPFCCWKKSSQKKTFAGNAYWTHAGDNPGSMEAIWDYDKYPGRYQLKPRYGRLFITSLGRKRGVWCLESNQIGKFHSCHLCLGVLQCASICHVCRLF